MQEAADKFNARTIEIAKPNLTDALGTFGVAHKKVLFKGALRGAVIELPVFVLNDSSGSGKSFEKAMI